MRIPKGMTAEEVNKVIERVSNRFSRFHFGIYDSDDIRQEAVLLCIDALDRYEEGRPLENFLCVHTRNRLLTLMRNYGGKNSDKHLINHAIPIDNVDDAFEKSMQYQDLTLEKMMGEELMHEINSRVPIERRIDLIKILNGAKVGKGKRKAIIALIADLFEEDLEIEDTQDEL